MTSGDGNTIRRAKSNRSWRTAGIENGQGLKLRPVTVHPVAVGSTVRFSLPLIPGDNGIIQVICPLYLM
jgi:hypothetical protein